ncbi:MAG: hypothetical protein M3P18_25540, partial [Actinomycetota bacterium]|nr:hypothetical protein [Actinomycetota bacterium]
MKVLLWHGYLMSGTGSNIYTANVARCWKRGGHDVLVMCQEPHPERFDFVDAFWSFGTENGVVDLADVDPPHDNRGRCRVVRPFIGDVLPVYVYDTYEGIQAKLFVDLASDELAYYTRANIEALAAVIESFEPAAIITGHEVMG